MFCFHSESELVQDLESNEHFGFEVEPFASLTELGFQPTKPNHRTEKNKIDRSGLLISDYSNGDLEDEIDIDIASRNIITKREQLSHFTVRKKTIFKVKYHVEVLISPYVPKAASNTAKLVLHDNPAATTATSSKHIIPAAISAKIELFPIATSTQPLIALPESQGQWITGIAYEYGRAFLYSFNSLLTNCKL